MMPLLIFLPRNQRRLARLADPLSAYTRLALISADATASIKCVVSLSWPVRYALPGHSHLFHPPPHSYDSQSRTSFPSLTTSHPAQRWLSLPLSRVGYPLQMSLLDQMHQL